MAKFDSSNHPFVAIEAGGTVIFRSQGNFLEGATEKNASHHPRTFYIEKNHRNQGGILQFLMKKS